MSKVIITENKTKMESVKKGTFFKNGNGVYMALGKTTGNFYLGDSASYFEAINVRTKATYLFPASYPVKIINKLEIKLK